jgi:phosphinothricin acetyltransferase
MADNPASLALHEKHGFRRVGFRERIGRDSTGHWRDVVLLERRSAVAGIE